MTDTNPPGMSQESRAEGREGRGRGCSRAAQGADPRPESERLASGAGRVRFSVNADEMERTFLSADAHNRPSVASGVLPGATPEVAKAALLSAGPPPALKRPHRGWPYNGRRRFLEEFGERMRVVPRRDAPSEEAGCTMGNAVAYPT